MGARKAYADLIDSNGVASAAERGVFPEGRHSKDEDNTASAVFCVVSTIKMTVN